MHQLQSQAIEVGCLEAKEIPSSRKLSKEVGETLAQAAPHRLSSGVTQGAFSAANRSTNLSSV